MKKIILSIALIAFFMNVFAQDTIRNGYPKEYYLQKSKTQKITAWILFGCGTSLLAVGTLMGINEMNESLSNMFSAHYSSSDAYIYVLVAGGAIDLASIPFFISASKNKRLAGEVQINNQKMYLLQRSFVGVKYVPGITVKINIGK